jgi:hypothetical protein
MASSARSAAINAGFLEHNLRLKICVTPRTEFYSRYFPVPLSGTF